MVEDADPLDSAAEGELPRSRGGAAYIRGRPDDNGAAAMPTAATVFLSTSVRGTYATASTMTKST